MFSYSVDALKAETDIHSTLITLYLCTSTAPHDAFPAVDACNALQAPPQPAQAAPLTIS